MDPRTFLKNKKICEDEKRYFFLQGLKLKRDIFVGTSVIFKPKNYVIEILFLFHHSIISSHVDSYSNILGNIYLLLSLKSHHVKIQFEKLILCSFIKTKNYFYYQSKSFHGIERITY